MLLLKILIFVACVVAVVWLIRAMEQDMEGY